MSVLEIDFLPDCRYLNDADKLKKQNQVPSDVSSGNTSLGLSFLTEDIGQTNKDGSRNEENNNIKKQRNPEPIRSSFRKVKNHILDSEKSTAET